MSRALVLLSLALGLTFGASTAQAAKGVKNGATGHHKGKVVSMQHNGKGGTLTIACRRGHKKAGNHAAAGRSAHPVHLHTYHVDQNTHVAMRQARNTHAASPAALRVGQTVNVVHSHHHADSVVIMHHNHHARNAQNQRAAKQPMPAAPRRRPVR
jgi:hypothetical protein